MPELKFDKELILSIFGNDINRLHRLYCGSSDINLNEISPALNLEDGLTMVEGWRILRLNSIKYTQSSAPIMFCEKYKSNDPNKSNAKGLYELSALAQKTVGQFPKFPKFPWFQSLKETLGTDYAKYESMNPFKKQLKERLYSHHRVNNYENIMDQVLFGRVKLYMSPAKHKEEIKKGNLGMKTVITLEGFTELPQEDEMYNSKAKNYFAEGIANNFAKWDFRIPENLHKYLRKQD